MKPEHIKGLFFQLVAAVGGSPAAGAYLGVSEQRVRQLYNIEKADDLPTLMQVVTLEAAVGRPIVTEALAAHARGDDPGDDLLKETCELSEAASDLQRAVRTGAPKREIQALMNRVQREAADLPPVIAGQSDNEQGRK